MSMPPHSILGESVRSSYSLFFWPSHGACRILVPQPWIEPASPEVEARNLNHWTAREVQVLIFYFSDYAIPRNISCKSQSKIENELQMEFLKYCSVGKRCALLGHYRTSGVVVQRMRQTKLWCSQKPLEHLPHLYFQP